MIQNFLKKLNIEKDFCFECEKDCDFYDRIFTKLTLYDYDWMSYRLAAGLPLRTESGKKILKFELEYMGFTECNFNIQIDEEKLQYKISCDAFLKYLKEFMNAHINSHDDEYSFYGGEIVLKAYNELIESIKGQEPTGDSFDSIIV